MIALGNNLVVLCLPKCALSNDSKMFGSVSVVLLWELESLLCIPFWMDARDPSEY